MEMDLSLHLWPHLRRFTGLGPVLIVRTEEINDNFSYHACPLIIDIIVFKDHRENVQIMIKTFTDGKSLDERIC
jgi:hypothetical protein